MHGGPSTGPRTAEGLARSRRSRWKHGLYSAEARAERKGAGELLQQSRELTKQMQAGGTGYESGLGWKGQIRQSRAIEQTAEKMGFTAMAKTAQDHVHGKQIAVLRAISSDRGLDFARRELVRSHEKRLFRVRQDPGRTT